MVHSEHQNLSRRERQIVDALYAQGESSVADVQALLPGSPSYSTVRAQLGTLVRKGHLQQRQDGNRYLYSPVLAKDQAGESAAQRLVDTFFGGSAASAVVGLLGGAQDLTDAEVRDIEAALAALKGQAPEPKR